MPAIQFEWDLVRQSLARPYPVRWPMVVLVSLVPLYIFIPELVPAAARYAPEIALDRSIPLQPAWSLVYGALYLFLIVLPVLVVRQEDQIRNAVNAYLLIWIVAYVWFIAYPTVAPRPASVSGEGFGVWGLRALYGADPPFNCFPSLHVAHSFVSAFAIHRVHRGVGVFSIMSALLVGLSTLFTKQHYVLDVLAGIVLAAIAAAIFLRTQNGNDDGVSHRAAPALAVLTACAILCGVAGFWMLYRFA